MKTWLFGLGGYGFAGKDTFADGLVKAGGWKKHYMSEPLEKALLALNPLIRHRYGPTGDTAGDWWETYQEFHARVGYDETKKNQYAREYLQRLGSEVGRKMFGENCWVNIAAKACDWDLEQGFNVALTGIRYPNELEMVHKADTGVTIWLNREGYGPVNGHASDNTLSSDDFDLILDSYTVEDLYAVAAQVKSLLERVGEGSLTRDDFIHLLAYFFPQFHVVG